MDGAESIKKLGWRQGAALSDALARQVAAPHYPDWIHGNRAIVLSQDCDVVHASYAVEPYVELIRARLATKDDPALRFGRNPRALQVDDGAGVSLDFSILDRRVVDRRCLALDGPDASLALPGEALAVLVQWVAKRYLRAAFPDAFNDRWRPSKRSLEKLVKRHGKLITGIFLMIDPLEECADGETYRVILRATATANTLADAAQELALTRATSEIAEALDRCDGIEMVDSDLVAEDRFTLADLHHFKRWDWDHRSHSGEPGGDLAPTP